MPNSNHPTQLPDFSSLSEVYLIDWASEKIFKRGQKYFQSGKVRDIVRATDNRILATVDGNRPYTTAVAIEDGRLASECTCPYGSRCKHVVALALACMKSAADKINFPTADENDRRLYALPSYEKDAVIPKNIVDILKSLNKHELIDILLKAIRIEPEIASLCVVHKKDQQNDCIENIVKRVRHAICREPEPDDDYGYAWKLPDYAPVVRNLKLLLQHERYGIVLVLAREMLAVAQKNPEMWDYDMDCPGRVSECMGIAAEALRGIAWPPSSKLIWAVDTCLSDEYNLCEDMEKFLDQPYSHEDWLPAVEHLKERLAENASSGYGRQALVKMTERVLAKSGLSDEILKLRENEAIINGQYLPFIEMLIGEGHYAEADRQIRKAMEMYAKKEPYLCKKIRECLIGLRRKERKWDSVLLMQTEDFVEFPSVARFNECVHTAGKLRHGKTIQRILKDFLVTGNAPWEDPDWPINPSGSVRVLTRHFPNYSMLIALAIEGKNPGEALKWYDEAGKGSRFGIFPPERLAEAVKDFAPERAVQLWKVAADERIAGTSRKAYEESLPFLRKIRDCILKQGMAGKWHSYLDDLRHLHRRKKTFLKLLEGIR